MTFRKEFVDALTLLAASCDRVVERAWRGTEVQGEYLTAGLSILRSLISQTR